MVAIESAVSRMTRQCRTLAKFGYHRMRPTPSDDRRLVLIAGQQRSGTNMLMAVLDRHWSTEVFHETDGRAFDNYVMRDVGVIERLYYRSRARHVVVKALCELQHLRALLDRFPCARALWAVRHYHDVSNSMAARFSSTATALKAMRTDPALGGWRGDKMSPSTHALLADCVDDRISEVSAAAFQWFMRNILYFEQGLERDPRVKLVFYEDLVSDPGAVFPDLLAFLAIDFQEAAVRDVFATSIKKAEPPAIDPRIEALCAGLFDRFSSLRKPAH